MLRVLPKRQDLETQGSGGAPQPAESTVGASIHLPAHIPASTVPTLQPKAPAGPPPEWLRTPAEQNTKDNDNKRKHSSADQPEAEQNAKHGVKKFKQFSDEHLDRWIWTAKGSMTWRQFCDKKSR